MEQSDSTIENHSRAVAESMVENLSSMHKALDSVSKRQVSGGRLKEWTYLKFIYYKYVSMALFWQTKHYLI